MVFPVVASYPDGDRLYVVQAEQARRRQEEREAAACEVRRPVCGRCGAKFTDDRWDSIRQYPAEQHRDLCKSCLHEHWEQVQAEQAAVEFKKFLIRIDKEVPAHLQVHLIVDNYGTHKTPAIKAWLAKHPRFELHFTPTGSSWINQVERWFGYLAHQMIRRGAHKNIQALESDIRTWVKNWNEDPQPFIWTKTAEEILGSLACFCRRISGAGH